MYIIFFEKNKYLKAKSSFPIGVNLKAKLLYLFFIVFPLAAMVVLEFLCF